MKHSITLFAAVLFSTVSFAQKTFTLTGEILNAKTPYIYLRYQAADGQSVLDSAQINNGKFNFKGKLDEVTHASLMSSLAIKTMDDPNLVYVYLEPSKMKVKLVEGDFKNLEMEGSKTQREYLALEALKQPIKEARLPIIKEYELKNTAYTEAKKALKELEVKVEKLHLEAYEYRNNFTALNNRSQELDIAFIKNNPDSYLSAHLMRFLLSGTPIEKAEGMYTSLSERVQTSTYGLEIADELAKFKKGSPGSPAFAFISSDINGEPLALSDFRGKYVLLDFWASWCVPCRQGNPHLLDLYAKYKDKGFEIIGISDDDSNPAAWKKAVEKDGIGVWKHIMRGLKRTENGFDRSNSISDQFGTRTLPSKILIDPNGMIIGRYAADGEDDNAMDKKLAEIFKS